MTTIRSVTTRRRRWWLWLAYVAAWIALGLWLALNVIIGRRNGGMPIPAWEPVTWELSSTLTLALLAALVYKFEKHFPLSGARRWRNLPAHLVGALVFSAAHTWAMVSVRRVVYASAGSQYDFGDMWLGFAYELQKDLITYALLIGACLAVRAGRARRQREVTVLRLERDLGEARLAQLTAQIEPHFVFNTLNTISNRMHEDVEAADRMIAAFAELLRAALRDSGITRVRVADDVAWLERYFALMGERFRGQLQTRIELDPDAADLLLPRLLLQPLVENAFEHGLKSGRGRIHVRIDLVGARLRCTIEDDGAGLPVNYAAGVGLSNVRRRLELLYPDEHQFHIGPCESGGTRAVLDLPCERHD